MRKVKGMMPGRIMKDLKIENSRIISRGQNADEVELMKKEKEKHRNEQKLKSRPFARKEKVAYLPSNEKSNESKLKSGKKYSFDISNSDNIFDVLLKDKQLILPEGRTLLSVKDLKGKHHCKFHQATSHSTNSCVRFKDLI
ncbi:hypothetical protein Ahy_A08g037493 [Arachis hypogaea]|uniref:Uncharacterized protein n=1 Tax=Arachis hypogaea TaxID=3818 RepID=A0A445BQX9_ARAHY|nr:hypothetical protein Ahy_A08g037493 [Arachis hypogaea]